MGYDMEEGTVVRWLVSENSEVKTGDAVAEIETDKAVVELESTGDGLLRKILVQEGSTVPVGQTIAVIAEMDEEIPEVYASDLITPEASPIDSVDANFLEIEQGDTNSSVIPTSSAEAILSAEVRASPVAKKLALERGVEVIHICSDPVFQSYSEKIWNNIETKKIDNLVFKYNLNLKGKFK